MNESIALPPSPGPASRLSVLLIVYDFVTTRYHMMLVISSLGGGWGCICFSILLFESVFILAAYHPQLLLQEYFA